MRAFLGILSWVWLSACNAGLIAPPEDEQATGSVVGGSATAGDPAEPGPYTFQEYNSTAGSVAVRVFLPAGQPGPYPALVLNHGFAISATQYTGTAQHLATFGYVVVLNKFSQGSNHRAYAAATVTVADWLKAGGDAKLRGKVDASKIAVMGHSLGGKVSFMAALDRPDLFRVVVGLDPVDTGTPSVAPERISALAVPTLLLGETWSGEHAVLGQMCAPQSDNYAQYYQALNPGLPTLEVTFLKAYHQSWLDNQTSCGLPCLACATNPNADHALTKRLSRRYAVAFLERALRGRTDLETFLWGDRMAEDVASGAVTYRRK